MSIQQDVLDMIISSHGINTADLNDAFDGEYSHSQVNTAVKELKRAEKIELVDGIYYATNPTLVTSQPAQAATAEKPSLSPEAEAELLSLCPSLLKEQANDPETLHWEPSNEPRKESVDLTCIQKAGDKFWERQIRAALGPHNDKNEAAVKCVMELVDKHANLVAENQSLYALIVDMRAAAGDPKGELMQDELIQHIKQLNQDAAEAKAVRDYYGGFNFTRPLIDIVKTLQEAAHKKQKDAQQQDYQTALNMLQCLLACTDAEDIALHLTNDTATISIFGHEFDLPHDSNEVIIKFMQSVEWMNGQEIGKAA
ncbi:hypothetical protein [Marinobacterium stanieri]|uniref:hypothetical protein n=1 Tax=Marinobacterium stanieri TaxID=49186 RepID=UPI000255A353|nr:hypothetical protein [Marinobacterium stanieri]